MTPGFSVELFQHIAAAVGCELVLDQARSGPAPGDDPFSDGRADFGWVCSTSWFGLTATHPEPAVKLVGVAWVPADPDVAGSPVYFSDLVVPAGSPITSIDDLAGRDVGCNDEVSLSGHYALMFALRERGHDPTSFANLTFTGGHRRSLELVAAGELEAAVVDSVVLASARRSTPELAAVRVVQRLGPWPVQPLVARSDLADDVVATARAALLASNEDPVMQQQLQASMLARFAPVDEAHYAPIVKAMGAAQNSRS